MLFGSLVVQHAQLHSCLCFSLLEKLFLSNLDSFSIPLDSQAIYRDPSAAFYRILNSSQQLLRSIKKTSGCSIATKIHRAPFAVDTSRQIFISYLDSYFSLFNSQQLPIALDPSRIMKFYLKGQRDLKFTFLDLSQSFQSLHLPKPLSLTPNLQPKCSLAFVCFFYF